MPSGRSFSAAEKLLIVKYAEFHGNREASEFSVNKANVGSGKKVVHKTAFHFCPRFVSVSTVPSIQKEMPQIMSDLVIIPGGMTYLLQPLGVSVSKPKNEAIRRKWNVWLSDSNHTYTASSRMPQPNLLDFAEWMLSTWNELNPPSIKQGFLKCCISNNLVAVMTTYYGRMYIKVKLKLQKEGFFEGYWNSFKDYVNDFILAIGRIKAKGEKYITELYKTLSKTYIFKYLEKSFKPPSAQKRKPITDVNALNLENILGFKDFNLSWILNSLMKLNLTDESELKADLTKLPDSGNISQNVIMEYISDLKNTVESLWYENEPISNESLPVQEERINLDSITKIEWFSLGFASCFLVTTLYNYILESE
ncbi:HTH CENPB-type domain-containing protein [Nephila pilipes]|uniref:HTH CENPB-type domain-containing protein n=1 Tax=Nephila pilipes TaxID=299642 RepID=A0A8X6QN67_NEPPI|nr:HTH CENPB-type domain-containing protein [Nephila pilipes]